VLGNFVNGNCLTKDFLRKTEKTEILNFLSKENDRHVYFEVRFIVNIKEDISSKAERHCPADIKHLK
jgi:hypothetical protein